MTPKIVVFDLDRTLAESKSPVTNEMGTLLAQLLQKMPVAVMSGGSYVQFQKQLLPALPPHTPLANFFLFPDGAGMCYRFIDGAWTRVDDQSFTPEQTATVMQALQEAMAETGFTAPPEEVWGERIEDRGAAIVFSALGQEAPVEAKEAWDPDRKKRTPLFASLIRRLPDFTVRINASTSIDITRKGITKAYGVRKLSELTGIAISDMLYIGDSLFPGGNDEVVKETGITTREVAGPEETAAVIRELL